MQNKVVLILLFQAILTTCCCNELSNSNDVEIGKPVSDNIIDKSKKVSILISPSQFQDGYEFETSGVNKQFTLDKDKKVKDLFVSGNSFITPEGLSLKSTIVDARKTSTDNGRMISGWGYLVKLKSGWYAVFANMNIIEDEIVTDTTHVTCFYKSVD